MHKDPIQSLFIGSKVINLPSCHSTNSVASDLLAENHLEHGTVIITGNQTAGKGQRGNKWESEPGKNLTLSIVLKPGFLPVSRQFDLTVISSLAIIDTLQDAGIEGYCIKWPNDVMVNGKKIAGILIENIVRSNKLEWAIVGIGLNVNQVDFTIEAATSLKMESGNAFRLEHIQQLLLSNLNKYYRWLQEGIPELRKLYLDRLLWFDQPAIFGDLRDNSRFKGVIVGVSQEGRLIIKRDQQEIAFDFKQIAFVAQTA